MRLLRLAWADVLERTRRPGYLVSLLVMVWLGHGMLPAQGAGYRTFVIDDVYRPSYGPEWVGTLTAILTGVYLMFVGFYLVRGTIERDRRSGVGAILSASRMGKHTYLASKALSHLIVLMSMACVVMLAAIVTQQMLGEDTRLDLVAVATPYLLITFPIAVFVSASAVFFDSTPVIRGGFGNVAWFFLLSVIMASAGMKDGGTSDVRDLMGAGAVARDVRRVGAEAYPGARSDSSSFSMGVNVNPRWKDATVRRFDWPGLSGWSRFGAARAWWLLVALGVLAAAAIPFDRFEHASGALAARRPRLRFGSRAEPPPALGALAVARADALEPARPAFRFDALFVAETRLLLRGQPWWWYAGVLALLIAGLAAPLAGVRQVVLPLASFWPVFVWSALGHREVRDEVASVLFSCARPLHRLLPASLLAGASLALVVGATGLVRLALAGEWAAVAGWGLCSLLAPLLALACGAWSGSGRLFEVLWLFAWYLGPMNKVEFADYTGVVVARSAPTWVGYGAMLLALAGFAWWGRARQLVR